MVSENVFLLYALIMGIFITFLYDVLRILRRVIPHSGFFVSLEDLGFWIYCAARVFLLLHRESDGSLRWFAVLGAIFGMYLYKKCVSPYFVKYVSLCLQKVVSVLLKPLRYLTGKFRKVGRGVSHKSAQSIHYIGWRIKKQLTVLRKVLKI